jgi:Nucleotide-binding protein implicated in inhibition of septum formation
LSYQKAKSITHNIKEITLPKEFNCRSLEILGCDSIFEFNGIAFGKPSNKEEAFSRWKKMSGEFGFLHTGHTLLLGNLDESEKVIRVSKQIKKTISSKVYFSKLQKEEIKNYVDSLEPL